MDYVRLGTTGLKVSRLCLGTMTYGTPNWRSWVLDEAASRPFYQRAIEHGINFFGHGCRKQDILFFTAHH